MEYRFIVQKALRKISLRLGIPRVREIIVCRTLDPDIEYSRFDVGFAKEALLASLKPEETGEMKDRAEEIRNGKFRIFGEPPIERAPGIFLTHPRTGRRESLVPWTAVKIGNNNRDEDIKFLWELNRLGDLDPLMALAILEARGDLLDIAEDIAMQWSGENPPGMGSNWFSNMEVALRLLRCLFLQGLMEAFDLPNGRVKKLVYEHAVHVAADWKASRRTMKGGNHLVVELAALAAFETLAGRQEGFAPEFGKEMERQFNIDGEHFEGSLGYHFYVLNVLVFVHYLCRIAGKPSFVSEACLSKAIWFARDFSGPDGALPRIGDWDDGHVFSPVSVRRSKARFTLDLGSVLTGKNRDDRGKGKLRAYGKSQMAAWRTGNGDLVVFRAADVDHGHSHLDMLSLHYLGRNGPVVMDGGTFQYNHSRAKRDEYRGLSAHSTVFADGLWPLRPLRAFAWQGKLKTSFEAGDDWAKGSFDFGAGNRIERTVRFRDDGFSICDKCRGQCEFWSQLIVPEAKLDGRKNLIIFNSRKDRELTVLFSADCPSPLVRKRFVSDCYGRETQVCAVLWPVRERLEINVDCIQTERLWNKEN